MSRASTPVVTPRGRARAARGTSAPIPRTLRGAARRPDRAAGEPQAYAPAFLDAKIATAPFYAEHVLPLAVAALQPATAGADAIYGVAADEL